MANSDKEIKQWGLGFLVGLGESYKALGKTPSEDKAMENIILPYCWVHLRGDGFTPGGDPSWVCGACGGGEHIMGIESPKHEYICPDCGGKKLGYYYEDWSWWKNCKKFQAELSQGGSIPTGFWSRTFNDNLCDSKFNKERKIWN